MLPNRTNIRQKGIHIFMEELNTILKEHYKRKDYYPISIIPAWYRELKVKAGRSNNDNNLLYYQYVFDFLDIPLSANKYAFSRFSCAKFVYVKDLSLRNFIYGSFNYDGDESFIKAVKFPSHADLKEFLVPEDLIRPANKDFIFDLI